MDFTIRTITEAEFPDFWKAITRGFGDDPSEDPEALERFRAVMPIDGTLGGFDGNTLVGTFGTFFFDVTVPGGQVPTAGTTVVSVQPTHRRRGLLRGMMDRHLNDMRDRGYPIAALWASEYGIYHRFGYGPATDTVRLKIDRRLVSFPEGPDDVTVRLIDSDEAARLLPAVYDAVRVRTPGMYTRTEAWWANRVLVDPESRRGGASKMRHLLAERDGQPVGYATYRQKPSWQDWKPEGEVMVSAHFALDVGARRALWSYLSHIDLFPHINVQAAPADHPMLWEVNQPRHIVRIVNDGMWVRILDVQAALEARTYRGTGNVVLAVTDPILENVTGSYRLEVEDGKGRVSRTEDDPDITFGIAELGSIYLGGTGVNTLVNTGRARASAETVDLVDALFRSSVTPFCPEVF